MARTLQSNAVKRVRGVRTSRLNADELPTLPGDLTAPPWLPADDRVAELFAVIVANRPAVPGRSARAAPT
jgi:hypothetical protein